MRSGSASRSIATIFPSAIVKPKTTRGRPPGAQTSPGGSVHERRLRGPGAAREGARPRPPRRGPPAHAPDLHGRSASARSTTSGSSSASSASKSPPREAARKASTTSRWRARSASGAVGRSLHPAACAAGELPCRGRGAPHDGRDLVEGHGEHVVQHEREPLGGSQRFEHHEQRETDRVGQQRFVLGVDPVLAAHDRLGHVRVQRLLAPRLARAQHVQAHPRDDRRQPSAQVLDAAGVGAAEPQPGFLHGVVRLAQRAEHPVGHRPQVGAVGLEPLRQPVVFVHRSHSLAACRHDSLTCPTRPM